MALIETVRNRLLPLSLQNSGESPIRIPGPEEAEQIITRVKERFVEPGTDRWWWTSFRVDFCSAEFIGGIGFRRILAEIANSVRSVWLLLGESIGDRLAVVECSIEAVPALIAVSGVAEYYLTTSTLDWLVAESHLDFVYTVGAPAMEWLQRVAGERPDEILRPGHGLHTGDTLRQSI